MKANVTQAAEISNRLLREAVDRHTRDDIAAAEALYRQVLALNPADFAALANLAVIALARGDFHQALETAERAIAAGPANASTWNSKAIALSRLGRPAEAIACCDVALRFQPDFAEALTTRAGAFIDCDDFAAAAADSRAAIGLRPGFAQAYSILGLALAGLGEHQEALASYDQAIALEPSLAEAHSGRGAVLRRHGKLIDAVAAYDRALACNPGFAAAMNNRAVILQDLRSYDQALAGYDASIAREPEYADAHWNRGLLKLLLGDYEAGWRGYAWRWRSKVMRAQVRPFAAPLWGGEDIAGKTILLHAEQGLGDTLQFCRYAPLVAARGATVVLETPQPLTRLMASLAGPSMVVTAGDALPHFDVHCPLLSLSGIFNTTLASIPAVVPYLAAEAQSAARWRAKLGHGQKHRTGLVWAGRRAHHNDHNRSISVEVLAPLLACDADFHCLQKDITAADRSWLMQRGVAFHDVDLNDLNDTAGLVAALDLVITVDTAAAHLAGALAKPVWVLLAYAPDFRWLTDRTDSPWYPTARLFRQPAAGDWTSVIGEVAAALTCRQTAQ